MARAQPSPAASFLYPTEPGSAVQAIGSKPVLPRWARILLDDHRFTPVKAETVGLANFHDTDCEPAAAGSGSHTAAFLPLFWCRFPLGEASVR